MKNEYRSTNANFHDIDSARRRGNPKGNPQNLIPGKKKIGKLRRIPSRARIEASREAVYSDVADSVSRVIQEANCSVRHLGRLLGRDMGRTIHVLFSGNDTKLSTLADIATAAGKRLVISFEDEPAKSQAA